MSLKTGSRWSNWAWDKPVKAFIWRSSRICRPIGGLPPWFFEDSLPHLLLRNNSNLHRPYRYEPRVRKRRPKQYPLMQTPRKELRKLVAKNTDLLSVPLLPPIASRNLLLLQSLPNSIPYRQDNVRRRKDAHRVGTAARGSLERLYRLPRRLQSDGGSSGRVRRALSTRS